MQVPFINKFQFLALFCLVLEGQQISLFHTNPEKIPTLLQGLLDLPHFQHSVPLQSMDLPHCKAKLNYLASTYAREDGRSGRGI